MARILFSLLLTMLAAASAAQDSHPRRDPANLFEEGMNFNDGLRAYEDAVLPLLDSLFGSPGTWAFYRRDEVGRWSIVFSRPATAAERDSGYAERLEYAPEPLGLEEQRDLEIAGWRLSGMLAAYRDSLRQAGAVAVPRYGFNGREGGEWGIPDDYGARYYYTGCICAPPGWTGQPARSAWEVYGTGSPPPGSPGPEAVEPPPLP